MVPQNKMNQFVLYYSEKLIRRSDIKVIILERFKEKKKCRITFSTFDKIVQGSYMKSSV